MMLTESEAWEAIADVYPYFIDHYGKRSEGLCDMIYWAEVLGDIHWNTTNKMIRRIDKLLGPKRIFLFRPYTVAPRVRLARKLAKKANDELLKQRRKIHRNSNRGRSRFRKAL